MMHHIYLNSPGGSVCTGSEADVPDEGFLTDANIYYNLPPPPPPVSSTSSSPRSVLSLPRGHLPSQQQLPTSPFSSISSSCPSSPNMPLPSPGSRRGSTQATRSHRSKDHFSFPHPRIKGSLSLGSTGSPFPGSSPSSDSSRVPPPPPISSLPPPPPPPSAPPVRERLPRVKDKKLAHTRSFDLDHLYQNLVRVATKPRSNSFSVPWRRKKKAEVPTGAPAVISKEAPLPADPVSPKLVGSEVKEKEVVDCTVGLQVPLESKSPKMTSSSSDSEDTGSEGTCDLEPPEIYPGITYLRETHATRNHREGNADDISNPCYHSTATLPLRNPKGALSKTDESNKTTDSSNNSITNNQTTVNKAAVNCSLVAPVACRNLGNKVPCNHYCNTNNQSMGNEAIANCSSVSSRPHRSFDMAASIDEWRRKERWLEKKRSSRNLRQTGESGEVHVAILYAQDGADWKNYLYELFTQMVPKEEGNQAVRVEMKNVEEIEDRIGGLEAIKLKEARLQIVIISPRFMSHIAGHGRSEIGQLFEPEKVLGLLLGVSDSQFSMAHLSALYSYKDWQRLKVRNSDLNFVEEVLCEGIKILNNNKLFSDCPDERSTKFKVTSRKITLTQKQVYILLNEALGKSDTVEILIEAPGKSSSPVQKFHNLNPYTIWFTMPDEFLKVSSILQITVLVNEEDIGSRQLKCESQMDTLRTILTGLSNPIEFMCQALNINPICEDLDQKLSEKVRTQCPLTKIEEPFSRKDIGEFPTWVHFSAYYGLERLTWALLELPGGEEGLSICNCYGYTPSIIAYQRGFYLLAQKLEDATLLASLATKVRHIPRLYDDISTIKVSYSSPNTAYNNPPAPRPLNAASPPVVVASYDTLPAPRVVNSSSSSPAGITPPDSINTSPVLKASCNNSKPKGDSQCNYASPVFTEHTCSIPVSSASMPEKSEICGKPVNSYLDMNVSPQERQGGICECEEEVYTLVYAWNEKTDIKAFIETNKNEIEKVKSKLEVTEQVQTNADTKRASDKTLPSVPKENTRFSDPQQQRNMVEKFVNLLQDSSSNSSVGVSKSSCKPSSTIAEHSPESKENNSSTSIDDDSKEISIALKQIEDEQGEKKKPKKSPKYVNILDSIPNSASTDVSKSVSSSPVTTKVGEEEDLNGEGLYSEVLKV